MNRALAAVLAAPLLATQVRAQSARTVDSLALRAHTYFLSHDLLEGRGTARRGGDVAARYLVAAAERLGLRPVEGAYLQAVPLVEAEVDTLATRVTVSFRRPGESAWTPVRMRRAPAFVIPNAGTARTLVGFEGEPVWVRSASDVLAAPQRLPPLTGRVALMDGVFGRDAAAADTLRARGAVGVIHLLPSAEVFDLYARSRGPTRYYLDDTVSSSSFVPDLPAVLGHPALALDLLPDALTDSMLAQPFALSGRHARVEVALRPRRVTAHNVIAQVPGRDPVRAAETIVFTAHYDHLGLGAPGTAGDSIYNGFSDNAAGSAMLLAIAQALTARPLPVTALFLWTTGEEQGLLGSDWFVAHPAVALSRIRAVINLDAGAPPAPSRSWRVQGGDRPPLGPLAVRIAEAAGWEIQASPATPNSDHFPFARAGVPAVFLVPGPNGYDGMTVEASRALQREWDRYHRPDDHWNARFPLAGLVRYAEYAVRVAEAAAGER